MRVRRQKMNKRSMQVYTQSFGFREPYQILLDGNLVFMAEKNKSSLPVCLSRILLGAPVKLMTTSCVFAELMKMGPEFHAAGKRLKDFERKFCSHSPAVSAAECLKEMVGAKNKDRYCVATQDVGLRCHFRDIPGVPLAYINKSVFILEPASRATMDLLQKMEATKMLPGSQEKKIIFAAKGPVVPIIKKKRKIKEPNPLSVKKSKKVRVIQDISFEKPVKKKEVELAVAPKPSPTSSSIPKVGEDQKTNKKKRKRVKKKSKSDAIVESSVSRSW